MIVASASVTLLLFGCAMYGCGSIARRAMGLPIGTWPMTMAIGVAAWIAIGGVLNLLRIAYPATIYLLLAIACGFMAKDLYTRNAYAKIVGLKSRKHSLYAIGWPCLAIVIISFAIVTQLAPSAFNHHDDYQKYFAHVARMVHTGTLFGSPLNTLGSESLGGQAFLQGLFVAYLPFAYINSADAVFCFALTVVLTGGVAIGRPVIAPASLLAMLVVWLIEPQYVNVTALYSAAALIFAVVTLSVDRREYAAGGVNFPPPAVIGLIYAALVALKPTFALFIVLHFLFCATAEVLSTRRIGATMKRALATASWGLVFIVPWVALYSPLYWIALTVPAASLLKPPVPAVEKIDLFATNTLFYGGSYAQYTFVVATFLICGAIVLARRKWSDPDAARFVGVCLALPLAYLIMLLAMGPLLAGYDTALRHFLPVLIGAAPAILVLCGWVAPSNPGQQRNRAALTSVGLAAIMVVWFAPDFWTRAHFLVRTGSMLSYLRHWPADATNALLTTSREVLQGPFARQLAELQQRVPAGETLLVLNAAPFLLDFARNPIIDVDIGGVANPWSKTPPLSYVLWQYNGFGIRQPRDYVGQMQGPGRRETYLALRGLDYTNRLQNFVTRSEVLINDGNTAVLHFGPDAALP